MNYRIYKHSIIWMSALVLIALVLGACGSAPTATPAAAPPAPATEAAPTEAAPTEAAPTEAAPTEAPTEEPTTVPTEAPTEEPTAAPTEPPAEEAAAAPAVEGITWQVTTYRDAAGAMATPVADATVTIQDGRVTGNAGCNGFFASYTLDGEKLSVEQGGATAMMCEEAVMAQEGAILASLPLIASYTLADEQLTLLDAEAAPLLTLAPQVAPALTVASLRGMR